MPFEGRISCFAYFSCYPAFMAAPWERNRVKANPPSPGDWLPGLLSGMIGMGGGILLSPLMLLFHWAKVKETAASSSLFILDNSISGLIGLFSQGFRPEPQISWIMAGLLGGIYGSYLGSHRLSASSLNYLLAVSVTLVCLKLILT
jgi:uncharacterized membrane protein YfcA